MSFASEDVAFRSAVTPGLIRGLPSLLVIVKRKGGSRLERKDDRGMPLLTMTIAAAAASLSVPSPANAISHGDYPGWALTREASAASVLHLVVDPDGRVAQCASVRAVGDQQLAKEVCRVLSRKKFQSPALRDGRKVHAFLDTMISFFLPDTEQGREIMALRRSPDAELSVNKLPSGGTRDVSIDLAYDATGNVTDCASSEREKEVALANVACRQRTLFDNTIRKDLTGRPVAYVTQKRIRFTIARPPK